MGLDDKSNIDSSRSGYCDFPLCLPDRRTEGKERYEVLAGWQKER